MKKGDFDSLFSEILDEKKIRLDRIIDSFNQLPEEEKIKFKIVEIVRSYFRDKVSNSPYIYSEFIEQVFLMYFFLNNSNSSKFDFESDGNHDAHLNLVKYSQELIESINSSVLYNNYFKLIRLAEKHFPDQKEFIDCKLITSVFVDYRIMRKVSIIYRGLEPEIKEAIEYILKDIELSIKNILSFWDDITIEEIRHKKTQIFNHKNSRIDLGLTDSIVEAIKLAVSESLNKVNLVTGVFTDEHLDKENIELILYLFKYFYLDDFVNKPLERLSNAFTMGFNSSISKKSIFLNDVLVLFKHPKGLSETECFALLNRNNSMTEDDIRREKIRRIKVLVKDLK